MRGRAVRCGEARAASIATDGIRALDTSYVLLPTQTWALGKTIQYILQRSLRAARKRSINGCREMTRSGRPMGVSMCICQHSLQ